MKIRPSAKLPIARTFSRPRNYTFAVVMPRFEDMFHSFYALELLGGVGSSISRLNLDMLLHLIDDGSRQALYSKKTFHPEYFDGVLFADIYKGREILDEVKKRKIPYIVMNHYYQDSPTNCVAIDNQGAAYNAVRYLIKLGHKRIATITGDLDVQSGSARLDGYKKALEEAGIPVKDGHIFVGDYTRTGARDGMRKFLGLSEMPTAVFCASDTMAAEAIDVCEKNKLKIPGDLSVVGFDDSPTAQGCHVPLTSVWQPLFEMGRLSAELLSQLIAGKKKTGIKILLPTEFKKRESCAKQ